MRFQVVVANPPFSLDKWDSGFLANAGLDAKGKKQEKMTASMDAYKRFDIGVPPSSKGDYAFVLHMLKSLDGNNGRMAVVLPHGVLFAVPVRERFAGRWWTATCWMRSSACPRICSMVRVSLPAFLCSAPDVPVMMFCSSMHPVREILKKERIRIFFAPAISRRLWRPTKPGRMWRNTATGHPVRRLRTMIIT